MNRMRGTKIFGSETPVTNHSTICKDQTQEDA